jgi:hypothetical protein
MVVDGAAQSLLAAVQLLNFSQIRRIQNYKSNNLTKISSWD